jgi:ATP-dependent helicase Lhr and Lhr-like helicase
MGIKPLRMTMSSVPSSSDAEHASNSSSFHHLHPAVQRWVYTQGWRALRKIQEDAITAILDEPSDLILAAATAAGKTEAVFLPVCSRLAGEETDSSVRVLAVSPLRALINDQSQRLESLAEAIGSTLTPWHGDIPASRKRRLLAHPRGILMITPESLEAMFILHGTHLRHLFGDLRYVVVDELHSFIGSERGRQLQSLLQRIELVLRRSVPRIALSATLGDMDLASEFLRPGGGIRVRRIISDRDPRELRLQLRGYEIGADGDGITRIGEDLFRALRGTDNLVFANTRADVELLADSLRRHCETDRLPNEFFPHHGSLSRELREDVERQLNDTTRPTTAICTSTLELGIDVGSVSSIGQVGTPHSVAALRQRLGRCGRRPEDPSILRIYVREHELTSRTPPQDELRPEVVQAIAVVSLLLERWYEPPVSGALHLSTLVQQVLSVIAQYGGIRTREAWRALCKHGPFRDVDAHTFGMLLRDLASHELIQQAGDGTIILGVAGERLVDHYTFYAAFSTPIEYRLIAGAETLGTLPAMFPLTTDAHIIFGGRRWRIVAIDESARTIHVEPAPGGRAPWFIGSGGLVHDLVRTRMREVYLAEEVPRYLDPSAHDMLTQGRDAFRRFALDERMAFQHNDKLLLFLWAGDRVLATVTLHLRSQGIAVDPDGLALATCGATEEGVMNALRTLVEDSCDAVALARLVDAKESEKHHVFLGSELLARDYASSMLDVEGARRTVRAILEQQLGRKSSSQAMPVPTDEG